MSEKQLYGNRILTEREYRVTALVTAGLKNKEVANVIGTTEHDKELHEGDLRQARALELRGTGALIRNEAQSRTCFIALMNSYEFGGVVRAPARNQGCQHEPITERSMGAAANAHPLFHRNPDTDKA